MTNDKNKRAEDEKIIEKPRRFDQCRTAVRIKILHLCTCAVIRLKKEGCARANREYTTEKGDETHVKKKILERGENISIKSAETMLPRESQC